MTKRVLDVGQCDPDHSTITHFLSESFGAEVVRAHLFHDAISHLQNGSFDLVLVNRLLDRDHSEGAQVINAMQADALMQEIPVMLVSNFAAAQQAAVSLGAIPGFGKAAIMGGDTDSVRKQLTPFLS
jgi:hypothetical protein